MPAVKASASTNQQNVVFLGDSLSAGYGVSPREAFPALLQQKITSASLPFKIVNAGLSGDTTASGLRRLDWVLKQKVDVLVLELGGNDGLRGLPVSATKTNLQAIIERIRKTYPSATIILAGMQLPPNWGKDYTTQFREMYSDLAKQEGTELVPFLLEGVGGIAELNQADLIHPNVEGHKIVSENVWKILEPVLKKKAAKS
ncbi:MAG: lipolytic protein family [Verrucomicrobiales bacterium]|nr:lipolytic protein family [Verrucomicrobiales bacterium]